MLNVIDNYADCYAYAECCILSFVMLSVFVPLLQCHNIQHEDSQNKVLICVIQHQ